MATDFKHTGHEVIIPTRLGNMPGTGSLSQSQAYTQPHTCYKYTVYLFYLRTKQKVTYLSLRTTPSIQAPNSTTQEMSAVCYEKIIQRITEEHTYN